jgi:type VI secretion system secreted protein VgrG
MVTGRSATLRLVPGRTFELEDLPTAGAEGAQLVTWTRLEVARREGPGAGVWNASTAFRAQPADLPFRAPLVTPRPQKGGLQLAEIVGPPGEEIHIDEAGRVRAQLRWDRDPRHSDRSGTFMRVAQRATSGSMLLPRSGWNVLASFEEGSPDLPSVVGRVYDAEHGPPYALPENKTKNAYKTATTPGGGSFNEVQFETAQGREKMTLAASNDMSLLVGNDENVNVSVSSERTVGGNAFLSVGANASEFVGGDDALSVAGSQGIKAAETHGRGVDGSESETIAGGRSFGSGRTAENKVAGSRKLAVSTAMIDATLGPIKTDGASVKVLVGGALVRASAKKVVESVKLASAQTVGGAKIELAVKSRAIAVGGRMLETVGGAMVLDSGQSIRITGKNYNELEAGLLTSVEAPTIVVNAKQQIVVGCGGSAIIVSDGSVEIRGATFTTIGAVLAGGKKVALNG